MCLWVCPVPRVLPLRATERPSEGTYGIGAIWKKYGVFSKNALFKSYGVKKPTSLVCGANGATFRQKFRRQGLFWFFQSLKAGYTWQRATSLSAVQLVQSFFVFRILSVTCSLTRALSQSLAHAQQLISAKGLHFHSHPSD